MAAAWASPTRWTAEAADRFEVVVIDPLSSVADALGLDFDKSNAEFVQFYNSLVQPLVTAGLAVAMLDNIGHAIEASKRAKGVSAEKDCVDLEFSCARYPRPAGLRVTATKTRSVRVAFTVGTAWIFDRESQLISLQEDSQHDDERHEDGGDRDDVPFRPTRLMERVSRTVEAQPGLSGKGVIAATEGKSTYLRLAIELLTTEGFIEDRGTARKAALHSLRPYREADGTASGSRGSESGSPAVPGTGLDTGSLVPPPYGGNKGPGDHNTNGNGHAVPDDIEARAERLLTDNADLAGDNERGRPS